MIVVGIDPGKTTGMCVFTDGEFTHGREATDYDGIARYISEWSPSVVVIEDFALRRGRPSDYHSPIRTIGVVEYLCDLSGIAMVLQSPAILKLTLPRVAGLHKSRHVRSAAAHATYYLHREAKSASSKSKPSGKNSHTIKTGSARVIRIQ